MCDVVKLKELKDGLTEICSMMKSLSEQLVSINESLAQEKFISQTENMNVQNTLKNLYDRQDLFFREYSLFCDGNTVESVSVANRVLDRLQSEAEKKKDFLDVIHFITVFHSSDTNYEVVLNRYRDEISGLNVEHKDFSVLERIFAKYKKLRDVFTMKKPDVISMLDIFVDLGKYLPNDFIADLLRKEKFYVSTDNNLEVGKFNNEEKIDNDIVLENNDKAGNSTASFEGERVTSVEDINVVAAKNEDKVSVDEDIEVVEEGKDKSQIDMMEQEDFAKKYDVDYPQTGFVSEDVDFEIEKNENNEKKKVGVSDFQNEVYRIDRFDGQKFAHVIFENLVLKEYLTKKSLEVQLGKISGIANRLTDRLFSQGYLQKVIYHGHEDIFVASSRGIKVIQNENLQKYLGIFQYVKAINGSSIGKFTNAAGQNASEFKGILLFPYSTTFEWLEAQFADIRKDLLLNGSYGNKGFCIAGGISDKNTFLFTGAYVKDMAMEDDYKELLAFKDTIVKLCEVKKYVFLVGDTEEQIFAYADWLRNIQDDVLQSLFSSGRVYYKILSEDSVRAYPSGEKFALMDVFENEESVEQSQKTDECSEKDVSDNVEEETVSAVEHRAEEINVSESSDVEKQEESDEESSTAQEQIICDSGMVETLLNENEEHFENQVVESREQSLFGLMEKTNDDVVVKESEGREKYVVDKGEETLDNDNLKMSNFKLELGDAEYQHHLEKYNLMLGKRRIAHATAYMCALANKYDVFKPLYSQLAYAINDMLMVPSYVSSEVMANFYSENMLEEPDDNLLLSAYLRTAFYNQSEYDYGFSTFWDSVSNVKLLVKHPDLKNVLHEVTMFKKTYQCGLDKYSDYRFKAKKDSESEFKRVLANAKQIEPLFDLSERTVSNKIYEDVRKVIFAHDGYLRMYLDLVLEQNKNQDNIGELKEYLSDQFIRNKTEFSEENIDEDKINRYISDEWYKIKQKNKATRGAQSEAFCRRKLNSQLQKIINNLVQYVNLCQNDVLYTNDNELVEYKKAKSKLLPLIVEVMKNLIHEVTEQPSVMVLIATLQEIQDRMNGDYDPAKKKYFYLDLLRGGNIYLNENYRPYFYDGLVYDLPELSFLSRMEQSVDIDLLSINERIQELCKQGTDIGSLQLLVDFKNMVDPVYAAQFNERYSLDVMKNHAVENMKYRQQSFVEDVELWQTFGQFDLQEDNFKESIVQNIEACCEWAKETDNFGILQCVIDIYMRKIETGTAALDKELKQNLEEFLKNHNQNISAEIVEKGAGMINDFIRNKQYSAAVDILNRLGRNDVIEMDNLYEDDWLQDFLSNYEEYYRKLVPKWYLGNTSFKAVVGTIGTANKSTRGGMRIVEAWANSPSECDEFRTKRLLTAFGFREPMITVLPGSSKEPCFEIKLKKYDNGKKMNYKHPIAAFGSLAEENGFKVVYLFGRFDADGILEKYKEYGKEKNTIVFLDFVLSLADRRRIARKAKEETNQIFAVVDRIAAYYIAKHYDETSVQRMLMSIIMPFAYYQPYVANSAQVMPTEMFIGREDELSEIERVNGVNIVYGGRQLGKSALLKMAQRDIDRNEDGCRAVYVDIKDKNSEEALLKIADELWCQEFFDDRYDISSWSELAFRIRERLMSNRKKIPYFLLLLDEADVFLESCAIDNYKALNELKDAQNMSEGRFKFVMAGLRDVVRFNKQCALGDNSVLPHFSHLTVKPFSVREAHLLLEGPLSYLGFRFNRDRETAGLISNIFTSTNYFPGLLQLYCTKLIEALRKKGNEIYLQSETPPYVVSTEHIKQTLGEPSFNEQIKEKFMITLYVGGDQYYYGIALLLAQKYHHNPQTVYATPKEILQDAKDYEIKKLKDLTVEKMSALMEELVELNILQHVGTEAYRFSNVNFRRMMGSEQEIDDILIGLMEE